VIRKYAAQVTFNVIQNDIRIHHSVQTLWGEGILCTHLRISNVRHVGIVEAMGLKGTVSRSSSMTSPAYHISWKSTDRFKTYWGRAHRQAEMLVILQAFFQVWTNLKRLKNPRGSSAK
jgi:hypothetical protein